MSCESNPLPKPPVHLLAETQAWFNSVVAEYDLQPHHMRLLTLAAEAWDRCQAAREHLQIHGVTYVDRFNAPRTRPEIAIERDARLGFARLLRELDLDVDPPSSTVRPPALHSNRRG
jgi:phage terminase small subunit